MAAQQPGHAGHDPRPDARRDVLKRLAYIEGHLAGVRRMIESDTYCVDVLKQTYAVRRAIEKMEAQLLDAHLHSCVPEAFERGEPAPVIEELVELYRMANQ